MRLSQYFLPLLKETPSEAQIASHRLMLRAGMIRQASAGIYSLAAAGFSGPQKRRADRARGAGPRRRARASDADAPAGRAVARKRPLRRLRQGDAAHQRPARARHALWAHQRGARHRHFSQRHQELPRPAEEPLSHPVEVPRRGAAALRRDARARVPDEGRLLLRHRQGRRDPLLLRACSWPI